MRVDFFSFMYSPKELRKSWLDNIEMVIQSGMFIGGPYVKSFEDAWATTCWSKFSVGVSNGLDGLIIGLKALGIGSSHKVAVPAHTFIATWTAILSVGATPIGIDVDCDGLMDLEKLEEVINDVDAVMPVHMHGTMVDMRALVQVCSTATSGKTIKIVEDASQAHGVTSREGVRPGQLSDLAVYSLYPTKNFGALGDAGVITTDNSEIYERLLVLRNYGSDTSDKYLHIAEGFNNRLDSLQAAVLISNLEHLDEWNRIRQELASIYVQLLEDKFTFLQLTRGDSVRHHLCILTENRNQLRKFLEESEIKTEIHYPRVAGNEAAQIYKTQDKLYPRAQEIANKTLSLPISQWHSFDQIEFVSERLLEWVK